MKGSVYIDLNLLQMTSFDVRGLDVDADVITFGLDLFSCAGAIESVELHRIGVSACRRPWPSYTIHSMSIGFPIDC